MTIGQQIKARRLALKLTQKDVAQKIGKSVTYVAAVERQRTSPTLKSLQPFLDALGGDLLIRWQESTS